MTPQPQKKDNRRKFKMINENVCASCGKDKDGVQGKSLYCKACNNKVEEMSARITEGVV